MKDGIVKLGTNRAKRLGLVCENFEYDSYLWVRGRDVIFSFIFSKAKGNLSKLVRRVQSKGFRVLIPTPVGSMPSILKHWGATLHLEIDEDLGEQVEMWSVPELDGCGRLLTEADV